MNLKYANNSTEASGWKNSRDLKEANNSNVTNDSKNANLKNANLKNFNLVYNPEKIRFNQINYPLKANRECYSRSAAAIEVVEFHLNVVNWCIGQRIKSSFCGTAEDLSDCNLQVRQSLKELSKAMHLRCISDQIESFEAIQSLFEVTAEATSPEFRDESQKASPNQTNLDDLREETMEGYPFGELLTNQSISTRNLAKQTDQLLLVHLIHRKSNTSRLIWPTTLPSFSSPNSSQSDDILDVQFRKVKFMLVRELSRH